MLTSAVIGCGGIGPHHAKSYQSTQEIRLGHQLPQLQSFVVG